MEDYLILSTKAERIERTKTTHRWLLVLAQEHEAEAIQFIDETFHNLFQQNDLPQHPHFGAPYRPGSKHSKSTTVNKHTEHLISQQHDANLHQYSFPKQRRRNTTLQVSYAKVAAKQAPNKDEKTTQTSNKQSQKSPAPTMNKVRNEIKQHVSRNESNLRADLESQVRSLTAQIEALKDIIKSLAAQVHELTLKQQQTPQTTPTKHKDPTGPTAVTTAMDMDLPTTSPRTPAAKRARHNNKSELTPVTEQDSTKTPNDNVKNTSTSTKTPEESASNLLTQPQLTHMTESISTPNSKNTQIQPTTQHEVSEQSNTGASQESQDLAVLESKQSDGTTSL